MMVVHPCLHVAQVSLGFYFSILATHLTLEVLGSVSAHHNFTKALVTLVNHRSAFMALWGSITRGSVIIVSLQALYCFIGFFTHSGHVFICSRHVIYGLWNWATRPS